VNVVFDLPLPLFRSPPFRCSDAFNRGNPICAPGFEISQQFMQSHRLAAVEAIDRLAKSTPGVLAWDTLPALCTRDRCTASDSNHQKFFDGDHLSGYGNELLVPSFLEFLRTAVKTPPGS
jgi:hypothetical protein